MTQSANNTTSAHVNDSTSPSGQDPTQNTGKMTLAEFEERLPDFFSGGGDWNDPRFQAFLTENPDSAALVRDLKYIADYAGDILNSPEVEEEPSKDLWDKISQNLKAEPAN